VNRNTREPAEEAMEPQKLGTSLALRAISYGLRLPEGPISRINELNVLKKLLISREIECVLDVGANRGQFAYELRGIGYTGRIVSFEPLEQEFGRLKSLFENDSSWAGHQFALGSKRETKEINVHEATVFSSFHESVYHDKQVEQGKVSKQSVDIFRLDEIFDEVAPNVGKSRTLLKMDTQGFDLEVFKGSEACLDHISVIQSELSVKPYYKGMPSYIETLSNYEAKGFKLFNMVVEARDDTDAIMELNCVMTRS
jgi:FkbM family methyltransferase